MIKAIFESVFNPRGFLINKRAWTIINRTGWTFIVLRWAYYSMVFSFRDHNALWKPFVPPPFGLDVKTYSEFQKWLAVPFGLLQPID